MNRLNLFVFVLALGLGTCVAKEVGVDLCFCQPSVYEITIGTSLGCDDTTVVVGDGIKDTACLIETRLEDTVNVTDFVPASVTEIQILELDQQQEVIGQSVYTDGPYFDGDSVTYTSIVKTNPELINEESLPLGFQVTVFGNNKDGVPLVNTWAILYNNDCGIFPLLTEGMQIGWSIFTDLGDPPLAICPVAPPTLFPTVAPTNLEPTDAPTSSPTDSPIVGTKAPVTPEPPVEIPIAPPSCPPRESKAAQSQGNQERKEDSNDAEEDNGESGGGKSGGGKSGGGKSGGGKSGGGKSGGGKSGGGKSGGGNSEDGKSGGGKSGGGKSGEGKSGGKSKKEKKERQFYGMSKIKRSSVTNSGSRPKRARGSQGDGSRARQLKTGVQPLPVTDEPVPECPEP